MKKTRLIIFIICVLLFLFGYVIGYFSQFYISPLQLKASAQFLKQFPIENITNEKKVTIPVNFLIKDGKQNGCFKDIQGELEVNTKDIALILIDTWGTKDDTSSKVRHISKLLKACRENGITVIHAPNYPVVEKYPQYHKLKRIVRLSTAQYYHRRLKLPFLNWPNNNNYVIQQSNSLRLGNISDKKTWTERDIAGCLKPLDSEFVVKSYEELRYILYKRRINTLFYVGSAVNDCMLHRETGIYRVSGIGNKPFPFTIVVFEDCVKAMPTISYNEREMRKAMLEYYKLKLAFISHASKLVFH